MTLRWLAACATIAALAASACASPADLVRKAYSAEKTAVYAGTMSNTVFVKGQAQQSRVRTYRFRSKSRVEYLSGPMLGAIVIDDGRVVYRLDRLSQTVSVALPAPSPDNVKLLLSNYNPVSLGEESVAGRRSRVVRLEPRAPGNPKAKLWIDTNTGVVLRNERYLYTGKLASRSEFTSIKSASVLPADLFAPPKDWRSFSATADARRLTEAKIRAETGFGPLKPSYLPPGYAFDGYFKRYTGSGKTAAVLKYTDGLNAITVFERLCGGAGGQGRGRGFGRRGRGGGRDSAPAPRSGGCLMRSDPQAEIAETRIGGIMVTVTANMDPAYLRKIAESF